MKRKHAAIRDAESNNVALEKLREILGAENLRNAEEIWDLGLLRHQREYIVEIFADLKRIQSAIPGIIDEVDSPSNKRNMENEFEQFVSDLKKLEKESLVRVLNISDGLELNIDKKLALNNDFACVTTSLTFFHFRSGLVPKFTAKPPDPKFKYGSKRR